MVWNEQLVMCQGTVACPNSGVKWLPDVAFWKLLTDSPHLPRLPSASKPAHADVYASDTLASCPSVTMLRLCLSDFLNILLGCVFLVELLFLPCTCCCVKS